MAAGRIIINRTSVCKTEDGVDLSLHHSRADNPISTVIFCHGYMSSMDSWFFQFRCLQRRFGERVDIILMDHRGHGLSGESHHSTYTASQLGADLAEVIRTEVRTETVILVGHSMGGMAVLSSAVEHINVRERISGMVLMSTSSQGGLDGYARLLRIPGLSHLAELNAFIPMLCPSILGVASMMCDRVHDSRKSQFLRRLIAESSPHTVTGYLAGMAGYNISAGIQTLASIPSAILCGDKDRVFPISHSEALHTMLPLSSIDVIPGAGHMMCLEKSTLISQSIVKFLDIVIGEKVHPELAA